MPDTIPNMALRVGDRVTRVGYGAGTITTIDTPYRGQDTYWVKFDDARLAKFGSLRQARENLKRVVE